MKDADSRKKRALTLGAAVMTTALTPLAMAGTNPFAAKFLPSESELVGQMGERGEGNCGEGNCGEGGKDGSCGGKDGSCGGKDASCGEGRCGGK